MAKATEASPPPAAPDTTPHVFRAIREVMNHIAVDGIGKDREVKDGVKFKFRGIDDVMNEFSGPMSRAGLMVLPSYSDIVVDERKTKSGSANYNIKLLGTFRFVSLVDGSELVIGSFYGEANDTADKATAKAQSISLRQAYLHTFVVPLGPEMDPEADLEQQEVAEPAPSREAPRKQAQDTRAELAGESLSQGHERILAAKLKQKGTTREAFESSFGQVDTGNYNRALEAIKAL